MYAINILPNDAAYYTLYKASIVDGIMSLQPGGYVAYEITPDTLTIMPDSLQVSVVPASGVDSYAPKLRMYLNVVYVDASEMSVTITPTVGAGEVFTQVVEVNAGEFTSCTLTIHSEEENTLRLWELCPEASNSTIEVEIDGVKQSVPKLLYDYNALPITVQQLETTVGLITYNLNYATDLQGNVSISYVASDDCVLTLRIKDTGVTELYTPILYDIRKGQGNIALPHAYLNRLIGLHSAYITLQVSTGTLTIPTRGLFYSIDGGYIADRELDAGMEVHDVSVCNTSGETDPEDLWVIGISANECIVKTRPYTNDLVVGFTPAFTLGAASKAAIEFNGSWYLNKERGHERYTLVTDAVPYVFWVDLRGNLYGQLGNDADSKFLIDTNVTDVSTCRGFSSTLMPEYDQGLIVLYVKRGVAKYVSYSYDTERAGNIDDPSSYKWYGPFEVPLSENVLNVNVHRLNDYRVGMALTTPTRNWWYISERTYVTQTMEPTTINVGYSSTPRIAVTPIDEMYNFSVEAALDNTKKNVTLTFSHNIRQLYSNETFLPEEFSGIKVSSISIVNDNTIVVHLSDTLSSATVLTYNSNGIIKFVIEPINNMEVAITHFSANVDVPALTVDNVNDNIAVVYSIRPTLLMSEIGSNKNNMSDTIAIDYTATGSIVQSAISFMDTSQHDQIDVGYTMTANIVLTQVGTHPI